MIAGGRFEKRRVCSGGCISMKDLPGPIERHVSREFRLNRILHRYTLDYSFLLLILYATSKSDTIDDLLNGLCVEPFSHHGREWPRGITSAHAD